MRERHAGAADGSLQAPQMAIGLQRPVGPGRSCSIRGDTLGRSAVSARVRPASLGPVCSPLRSPLCGRVGCSCRGLAGFAVRSTTKPLLETPPIEKVWGDRRGNGILAAVTNADGVSDAPL